MSNTEDQPLIAAVEGDQLVIRIGIGTLAFAAEHCSYFYDDDKHAVSGPPYIKIANKQELATDIVRALQSEAEDGSSPLTELLDTAIADAHDDGSLAFHDDDH